MTLTRRQRIFIGILGIFLIITTVVGLSVGLTLRRKPTNEQSAHDILAQNPLIDG